jgi:hypothetical protein
LAGGIGLFGIPVDASFEAEEIKPKAADYPVGTVIRVNLPSGPAVYIRRNTAFATIHPWCRIEGGEGLALFHLSDRHVDDAGFEFVRDLGDDL